MKNNITNLELKDVLDKYYKMYEVILNYKIAIRKFSYDIVSQRKYRRFGITSLVNFAEQLGIKGLGDSRLFKLAGQWYYVKKFDLDVRRVANKNLWKKVYIVGKRCGVNLSKKEVWQLILIPREELYKSKDAIKIIHYGPHVKLCQSRFKERFLEDCRKFYEAAIIDSVVLMKEANCELYKNREFERFGLTFNMFFNMLEIGPQSYFWVRYDYHLIQMCNKNQISLREAVEGKYLDKIKILMSLLRTGKYAINQDKVDLLKSSSPQDVKNNKTKYLVEV